MSDPWPSLLISLGLVFQAEVFWAYRDPIGRLLSVGPGGEPAWHLGWPYVSGAVGLVGLSLGLWRLWSSGARWSAVTMAALALALVGAGYAAIHTRNRKSSRTTGR
jgi:hypothetical protein